MEKADHILYSTAIFDSVQDRPFPGAVVIRGNRIIFVGDRQTAETYASPDTTRKDFGNQLIMPGFFDGHGHYQTAAVREFGDCIKHLEGCRSEQEVVDGVVRYLEENPNCQRVHGRCFFLTSWGRGAPEPTRASLDAAVPDIPVYLLSSSGHSAWLNSAAINECHLDSIIHQHPEWPDEYARRDENGELTGFLCENLSYTVRYIVEVYDREDIAQWDEQFMHLLNKHGITSFTECNALPARVQIDTIEPLKRIENQGALTIRYHQWCGTNVLGKNEDHAAQSGLVDLKYLGTYFSTDKIRVAGAKFMLDGVPDTCTGAMLQPYANRPAASGDLLSDPEAFCEAVECANNMGLSVKVHCLGDRSTKVAIDAFERSWKKNGAMRNAVEHMNIITDENVQRMAKYGVIASVQPAHLTDWLNGCGEVLYGPERNRKESRYRDLINAGVKISVGTDTPVVRVDPIRTIYAAVTRRGFEDGELKCSNPDQAMTLAEVLKGYTIGAAFASGFEDRAGTLEAGKLADVAVISRNLFELDPEQIKQARNICTIFDGKIVYEG